jgi:hypothetical protein
LSHPRNITCTGNCVAEIGSKAEHEALWPTHCLIGSVLLDGWARLHSISASDCKRALGAAVGGRIITPGKSRIANQYSRFDLVRTLSFLWKI